MRIQLLLIGSALFHSITALRSSSKSIFLRLPSNKAAAANTVSTNQIQPEASSSLIKQIGKHKPSLKKNAESSDESLLTLTMFMIEATRSNPDHADLESLLNAIQISCKTISNLVSRAGITNLAGDGHPGERLDLLASRVLRNALRFTGKVGSFSYENDRGGKPILIEGRTYTMRMRPLHFICIE